MIRARSWRRGCTGLPCSITVEGTPASARRSAAQAPAGPDPTITTRGTGRLAGHANRGPGRRDGTQNLIGTRGHDAQPVAERTPLARVEGAPHDADLTHAAARPPERAFDARSQRLVGGGERNE